MNFSNSRCDVRTWSEFFYKIAFVYFSLTSNTKKRIKLFYKKAEFCAKLSGKQLLGLKDYILIHFIERLTSAKYRGSW